MRNPSKIYRTDKKGAWCAVFNTIFIFSVVISIVVLLLPLH